MTQEGSEGGTGCSHWFIQKKKAQAESVYQQEVARWEKEKSSNKNGQWVSTVVEAGTIRDKVDGLVLLIQQSPFHRLATLDQLLTFAQSHTTRIAILSMESIRSLFFASYLPDTKLSFFGKHFESMSEEEAEHVDIQTLVRWYYEDAVKARYATFIQCLERAAHSPLHEAKSVAIGTLQKLLIEKPEQENTILSLLVDKMGDPHSKTATWTTNLILGVLEKHPNMKLVIAKEVQLFINRHSPLTTTIPLSLLSHIVLARGETELANMLVSTYFRQLKALSEQKIDKKKSQQKSGKKKEKKMKKLKKNFDESSHEEGEEEKEGEEKGANDTKMVSVLLTGVNRAFPYSQLPQDVYESHLEILFELVENGGFNRKVLGLAVIFKVIKLQQDISDSVDTLNRTRFYHLLYDLLLSPEMSAGFGQPNYKQAFFALVEGAIAADKDILRARAFVKRLLVMSAYARPGFACSSILLASRLFKEHAHLATMVSSLEKPRVNKPDPIFHAEGNNSCLWELCALRCHYHPLVARWAQLLFAYQQIQYSGDPLDDLSTNTFLSRFQNKQPANKHRGKGKVVEMQPRRSHAPPVTFSFSIKDFQKKKTRDIRPDELYFFKYLKLKIATLEREDQLLDTKTKKKKKGKEEKEKKKRDQVSAEALQGLLEAEAADGNFGMDGEEWVGESDDDDDESGNEDEGESGGEDEMGDGFGTFSGKRGEKRKAPETTSKGAKKEANREKKGKKDGKKEKKGEKKGGKKGGKKAVKGTTKKQGKKNTKKVKQNSKRQKIK